MLLSTTLPNFKGIWGGLDTAIPPLKTTFGDAQDRNLCHSIREPPLAAHTNCSDAYKTTSQTLRSIA